jgi:CDP-diglyceride synthetase
VHGLQIRHSRNALPCFGGALDRTDSM